MATQKRPTSSGSIFNFNPSGILNDVNAALARLSSNLQYWININYFSKHEYTDASTGATDRFRPVVLDSVGKLDASLYDYADFFSDTEGDPAGTGTTADGTSTYAARRDHVHAITWNDAEGNPADVAAAAADGTSVYPARRDHAHTIGANIVTAAMMADMAQATIRGRASGAGTGDPTDLTAAQVVTILTGADGTGSLLDADLLDGNEATAFPLLLGRAGGQTLIGGTASGNDLILTSTSHATKGDVFVSEGTGLSVGTANTRTDADMIVNGRIEIANNIAQNYRAEIEVDGGTAYLYANEYYDSGWQLYDSGKAPARIQLNNASADSSIGFYTKAANSAQSTERVHIDKYGETTITTGHTSANGLVVNLPSSTAGVALDVTYNSSSRMYIVAQSTDSSIRILDYNNGSSIGPYLQIGQNNNGSTPAAGTLLIDDKGGTPYYIWPDDSGNLRIGTTSPSNANDTSGTVVGTQTSHLAAKLVLGNVVPPEQALANIIQAAHGALKKFKYRSGAFNGQEFEGIITDHAPRYGMDNNKSLNTVTLLSDLIQAVAYLSAKLERMEGEL